MAHTILVAQFTGLSGQALALLSGVAGALIGTAVGIIATGWALRGQPPEESTEERLTGAMRVVGDELLRLAATAERCASGIDPARGLQVVRAADLVPPLREWAAHHETLARYLDGPTWRAVAMVPAEWALIYEELHDAAATPDDWPCHLRRALGTLHAEALTARDAMRAPGNPSPPRAT